MKDSDLLIVGVVGYLGYTFIQKFQIPPITFNVTPTLNIGGGGASEYGGFSTNSSGGWTNPLLPSITGAVEGFNYLMSGGGGFRNTTTILPRTPEVLAIAQPQVDRLNTVLRGFGLPEVSL